jgi:hypothetical protein
MFMCIYIILYATYMSFVHICLVFNAILWATRLFDFQIRAEEFSAQLILKESDWRKTYRVCVLGARGSVVG